MVDNDFPNPVDSTASQLLRQIQNRDEHAWARFVELYGGLILHWCRAAGLSPEDRADVSQEVLRAVARHIADFHGDQPGDSLPGWLLAITKNKLRDHFARRRGRDRAEGGSDARRRLEQQPDTEDSDADEDLDHPYEGNRGSFIRHILDIARAEFEDRTWKAFWRTTVDGHESGAVADELSLSPAAVRMAKSRVLRRLRSLLANLAG